ncbi:hypothetical protein [Nocardia gipuzkoensis]
MTIETYVDDAANTAIPGSSPLAYLDCVPRLSQKASTNVFTKLSDLP